MTGNYPFVDIPATIQGNVTYPKYLSSEVIDLMKGILTVNTGARLSIEQILSHPWISLSDALSKGPEAMVMPPLEKVNV